MYSRRTNIKHVARTILGRRPEACAKIFGGPNNESIAGEIFFYQDVGGIIVVAEVSGLPVSSGVCGDKVFGFHIHEGFQCSGTPEEPFDDAGEHYDPSGCPHPEHAGDMPPLFGNEGYALSIFFTNRFTIDEIRGRTVIIHADPDDFTTQPSGNSGTMIACGEIK